MRCKFRALIASNVGRRSTNAKQLGQTVNQVLTVEAAFDVDGQTSSDVLVNQCQHPERTSIARLVVYKVITPYVIASLVW